jgi:hypothetical protein
MLDPTIKVAIITALPPTVVAAAALITSLSNHKDIKELHVIVNSRLSELLEQKGKAEHAAGRREGIESKSDVD